MKTTRPLRKPAGLLSFLANAVAAILVAALLFSTLHIAAQDDFYEEIHDELDDQDASDKKLQRAARAVCADHPQRAGRAVEPRWTADGQIECLVVIAREGGAQ